MFEHKGYKIEINRSGRFISTVEDLSIVADSLAEATAKIEEAIKLGTKKPLNLKVIGILKSGMNRWTVDVEPKRALHKTSVVGINRTTGDLMFESLPKDMQIIDVVPDTPENEKRLARLIDLRTQLKDLEDELRERAVISGRNGRTEAAKYSEVAKAIEDNYYSVLYKK